MIFGLGFLLASLCALIALPTVNARATRLARRRIEATLPVSTAEVAAERDHLRAEFAVAQRRLERRVEAEARCTGRSSRPERLRDRNRSEAGHLPPRRQAGQKTGG